jgi:hypothetical protein
LITSFAAVSYSSYQLLTLIYLQLRWQKSTPKSKNFFLANKKKTNYYPKLHNSLPFAICAVMNEFFILF